MLRPGRIIVAMLVAVVLAIVASATVIALGGSTTQHGVPNYVPSHIVSEVPGSTTLRSPDSVQKIATFYQNVIRTGGWNTVSDSTTGPSASLTIKKGHQGASISISTSTSGTLVSITTYPTFG
jgi:hypothetical protein